MKYRDRVLNSISTDLPLSISAPLIPDDAYWKKCATRKFLNCDPSRHGGSWKRLFFENYVQNLVESYVPNSRSLEPASGTASLPSSMQQQQHQKSSNPLASSASNSKTAPTSTIAVAATNAALGKGPDQFTDTNKLMEELKLSAPFVKAIEIIQMRPKEPAEGTIVKSTDPPADHIGADILFGTLVNLEDACFYYG